MSIGELWQDIYDTNVETYELMYACHRKRLKEMTKTKPNLIKEVITNYMIKHGNLPYVIAVLIAAGYDLDRHDETTETPFTLILKNRYYAEMMFPMTCEMADSLKTSHNIRRHITIHLCDIEKLRNILERIGDSKIMYHSPMNEYNNAMTTMIPLSHVVIVCSDVTLERIHHEDLDIEIIQGPVNVLKEYYNQ